MTWRESIERNPASFRGAGFFLTDGDLEVGRRTAVIRYPGNDRHRVRDLAKNPRAISINAYVIGDNYQDARDALLSALEEPGPGTLVHPLYGRVRVTITGPARCREGINELGCARISFACTIESGAPALTSRPDTRGRLESTRDVVNAATAEAFVDEFTVSGLPSSYTDTALSSLQDIGTQMTTTADAITGALAAANTVAAEIAAFTAAAESLMTAPSNLVDRIVSLNGRIAGIASTALEGINTAIGVPDDFADAFERARQTWEAVAAMANLGNFGEDEAELPTPTPNAQQEADNRNAIFFATRASAIAEIAAALPSMPFDSRTLASDVEDLLFDQIDGLLDIAPDGLQGPLRDLLAAIHGHLQAIAATLPEVGEYTPAEETPALVIAHDVYQDSTQVADVVARNAIRHPLFVEGGTAIEVLRA
jgi:prophage DNA circulation protein